MDASLQANETRLKLQLSLCRLGRLFSGRSRRLLKTVGSAEFLGEALDAPGRIDEFLLAREEGMALRADIDADLRLRAAGGECVAAGTVHLANLVFGMDLGFHESSCDPPDVRK